MRVINRKTLYNFHNIKVCIVIFSEGKDTQYILKNKLNYHPTFYSQHM